MGATIAGSWVAELVAGDPEFPGGFDYAPSSDKAGMHDKCITSGDASGLEAVLRELGNAGKDDAKLEGSAFDRTIGAGSSFPNTRAHCSVIRLSNVPAEKVRCALNQPIGRWLALARFRQVVVIDEGEFRHDVDLSGGSYRAKDKRRSSSFNPVRTMTFMAR